MQNKLFFMAVLLWVLFCGKKGHDDLENVQMWWLQTTKMTCKGKYRKGFMRLISRAWDQML